MSLFHVATFESIELEHANELLRRWNHAMGPLERGDSRGWAHVLKHEHRPVAVATTSYLIRQVAGGGQTHLTRENTCELSRLCAERSGLCRVALRLWREFVFPSLPFEHALSYQDADLHTGATYRFDGWTRGGFSSSGTDARSGKRGRRKRIWTWGRCASCPPADGDRAAMQAAVDRAFPTEESRARLFNRTSQTIDDVFGPSPEIDIDRKESTQT